jgi:tetratricopeptide (TPR) repeat protein
MSRINRLLSLTLVAVCMGTSGWAAAPKAEGPNNSKLDGELFYQLLMGEITAHDGDRSSAYAIMLDAARKANSERLYERAVEIAFSARSGELALDAVQAWARAFPSSQEANRLQLQILLGLNKIAETQEPLKRELARQTATERVATINLLPRYFARVTDKKLAASVVEKVLAPEINHRTTGAAAWAAIGSLRLLAEDTEGALEAARRGAAMDPESDAPALLAIALIDPKTPTAETMVRRYLAGKPTPDVRMAYARHLINAQRYPDAYTQMHALTEEQPQFPEAWLMRGSLELQDGKLALAETSLKAYIALAPAPAETGSGAAMGRGQVQAYLLLSQAAEQGRKLGEALAYLDKISGAADALRVERRRASILARQGHLEQARSVIRNVPELQSSDALAKINAEVQLLRENRHYAQAYELLHTAYERYPDEIDVQYDLAMMAERLGKTDEMEQLLRKVMAAKPDYHHAYNALGYSLADRNIRLNEARELIKQALSYSPDDPFIVDSLAWVEFRAGNTAEALRLLQGAFQARPDAEIAAHLGEVLWSMGQRDQASTIWKEGVELNPQNETLQDTMRRLRSAP